MRFFSHTGAKALFYWVGLPCGLFLTVLTTVALLAAVPVVSIMLAAAVAVLAGVTFKWRHPQGRPSSWWHVGGGEVGTVLVASHITAASVLLISAFVVVALDPSVDTLRGLEQHPVWLTLVGLGQVPGPLWITVVAADFAFGRYRARTPGDANHSVARAN